MKINQKILGITVLAVILGTIFITSLFGLWKTTGSGSGNSGGNSFSEESGEESVIKGSTTFNNIIDMGISKEDMESVIGADISDTSEKIKDFSSGHGMEFSDVKEKIQELIDEMLN